MSEQLAAFTVGLLLGTCWGAFAVAMLDWYFGDAALVLRMSDPLAPARGLLIGLFLGVLLWALLALAL